MTLPRYQITDGGGQVPSAVVRMLALRARPESTTNDQDTGLGFRV